MKKIFTAILGILFLSGNYTTKAQSFSVQKDTAVFFWPGGTTAQNFVNGVINPTTVATDSITIQWKVIATDFPSDWISNTTGSSVTGVCDNNLCYIASALWPSSSLMTSKKYGMGTGDFHLQTNLSAAATGTHYMTVRMYNQAHPSDSVTTTFIINKWADAVPQAPKIVSDIALYPNPATNELNLRYDASADIKTIAVYNIIGRVMTVYKATDNTGANLNLENIPTGVYFVRLMNNHGDVVATKKFNKQ